MSHHLVIEEAYELKGDNFYHWTKDSLYFGIKKSFYSNINNDGVFIIEEQILNDSHDDNAFVNKEGLKYKILKILDLKKSIQNF